MKVDRYMPFTSKTEGSRQACAKKTRKGGMKKNFLCLGRQTAAIGYRQLPVAVDKSSTYSSPSGRTRLLNPKNVVVTYWPMPMGLLTADIPARAQCHEVSSDQFCEFADGAGVPATMGVMIHKVA
jgi:hypothetical protein